MSTKETIAIFSWPISLIDTLIFVFIFLSDLRKMVSTLCLCETVPSRRYHWPNMKNTSYIEISFSLTIVNTLALRAYVAFHASYMLISRSQSSVLTERPCWTEQTFRDNFLTSMNSLIFLRAVKICLFIHYWRWWTARILFQKHSLYLDRNMSCSNGVSNAVFQWRVTFFTCDRGMKYDFSYY